MAPEAAAGALVLVDRRIARMAGWRPRDL